MQRVAVVNTLSRSVTQVPRPLRRWQIVASSCGTTHSGSTLLQLARLDPDCPRPGRQALAHLSVHQRVELRQPYWPVAVHQVLRTLGKALARDGAPRAMAVTSLRALMTGTVNGKGFSLTDWLTSLESSTGLVPFKGEHRLYQLQDLMRALAHFSSGFL